MLVSWSWLSRYLDLQMTPETLADALSLSGLNHEETVVRDGEVVIDLEVTSNRGDCLGHIGVAREIAVLYDLSLRIPDPNPPASAPHVGTLVRVSNDYPDACPRYTARVIRGCRVGTSPAWLSGALRAIGIGTVNNVVDVTNYVMMECGQPLHAFDLAALSGPEICVRPARSGETIDAIDHKTYSLDPTMCVIADADKAVAVAGVMGGAATEVDESTRDLLIEAAIFTPMAVRQTARTLKLHSPSSFRFERRVDPEGVDWASRRACELILELAGGELAEGVLDAGEPQSPRGPVVLRLSQIERVLGIRVDRPEVARILSMLGCRLAGEDPSSIQITPPSWRHDLTREADMIEEVARINGYDRIPEDSPIPVAPSAKREYDHWMDKVRTVMAAAGINEAMTPSVVTDTLDATLSPWTDRAALQTLTPLLRGANRLRRSLLPSLLHSRAENWASASLQADLYEVAHVYLPGETNKDLPVEQYTMGMVTGRDFFTVKGIIEALTRRVGIAGAVTVRERACAGLRQETSVAIEIDGRCIGYMGAVDDALNRQLKLPGGTTVCELSIPMLISLSQLVPQFRVVSQYPTISRDLNMVLGESVRWADLAASVRAAVGVELAGTRYRETYRAPEKDGADTKRILFSVDLQRADATLTGDEADAIITAIINRCQQDHGAKLLA